MKEILIRIPEMIYDGIKKRFPNDLCYLDVCAMAKAIVNGTILPKGHGRLIDADEYLTEHRPRGILDELLWTESEMYKRIQRMPTIVEADKEGAEE